MTEDSAKRLAELLRLRAALEAETLDAQLKAIDRGIEEALDAVALESGAERMARLEPSREAVAAAELAVVQATRDLSRALGELETAEAHVRAQHTDGAWVSTGRVPVFLRRAVRRVLTWWTEWYPELLGLPARTQPAEDAAADATGRIELAEARIRALGYASSSTAFWLDELASARATLAEIELGPAPGPTPEVDEATRMYFARRAANREESLGPDKDSATE